MARAPKPEPDSGIFNTPLDNGGLEDGIPDDEPYANNGSGDGDEQRPIFAAFDDEKNDEKTPKPHTGPREPLTDLVTLAWGGVGMMLVQSEADPPVGRVLQFQAPMAGVKLDALIAGTWIDALLQPLAKKGDNLKDFGALVLLPLMIGAYERAPEAMMPFEPIMKQLVRSSLVEMVPVMKKQRAEEARAAKAMADLTGMLDAEDFPKGTDPIDVIMSQFFRDVVPPEADEGE